LGSDDHFSCSSVERHVFPERPPAAINVAGPSILQGVCWSSEQGSGAPDQKTEWKDQDPLTQAGAVGTLFGVFTDPLLERGYQLHTGTVVDSTMVPVPRQRNSRDANGEVKNGRMP